MWASGARLEGTCGSIVKSADWKEASDGSGGWLATGCSGGTVGVSWISSPASIRRETADSWSAAHREPHKLFSTLTGHLGEVDIVRWMPTGMQLASYDSWGYIILWSSDIDTCAFTRRVQINPAVMVTDIQWSPCGSCLMACASSGKVMLYSSDTGACMFSLYIGYKASLVKRVSLNCCSWNKLGTRVAFGTSSGEVVLLDPESQRSRTCVVDQFMEIPVEYIDWYGPVIPCQRPNMPTVYSQGLFVYLKNGSIYFQLPGSRKRVYRTGIIDGVPAWNEDTSLLTVVGKKSCTHSPTVAHFFSSKGELIYTLSKDFLQFKFPLRNVLWTLQDSVVMFSCGPHLYSLKVDHSLPSLETLCQHTVISKIIDEEENMSVELLPLPKHMIRWLAQLNEPLIPSSSLQAS